MSSILLSLIGHRSFLGYLKDPLYRNSLFIVISCALNAGCGFLFWMIVTRLYTVAEVGLATAACSSLGIVVLLSLVGFDVSLIRFFTIGDKAKILGTILVVTTIVSLILAMGYLLLIDHLAPSLVFLREPVYALVFLIIAVMNSMSLITQAALLADRKADHYLLTNLLMVLKVPLLIALAFLGMFGIFCSMGISYLVASFYALLIMRRGGAISPELDVDFLRRTYRFSFLGYGSNILSLMPSLVLPIMVLDMLGKAEAAKYFISFAMSNILVIIPNSLGISLFVEGSHGEGLRKNAIRAGGAIFIVMIPAVLVLCLSGDRLLGLLGEGYVEAYGLLRVLALSSLLMVAEALFIPIQRVRMRMKSLIILNALKCMLVLVLSYVFIRQYGLIGAGYGWMLTYGIIVLLIGLVSKMAGWI
jgi:O-antigen/teichoic acid export membrane protein